MDGHFFDNITREEYQLADGTRIGLPICYGRWPMFSGSFPVLSSRIQKLLPSPKLKAAQVVPGIGVISLAAFQYREIEAGSYKVQDYDELAIMVPVLCEARVN